MLRDGIYKMKVSLTLYFEAQLKLHVIETVEKGDKTKAELCRENGIAPSSLSTILKDSENQGTRQHKKQGKSILPERILPLELKDKDEGGGVCVCAWEERSNS